MARPKLHIGMQEFTRRPEEQSLTIATNRSDAIADWHFDHLFSIGLSNWVVYLGVLALTFAVLNQGGMTAPVEGWVTAWFGSMLMLTLVLAALCLSYVRAWLPDIPRPWSGICHSIGLDSTTQPKQSRLSYLQRQIMAYSSDKFSLTGAPNRVKDRLQLSDITGFVTIKAAIQSVFTGKRRAGSAGSC